MQKEGRVIAVKKGQMEICFERPEACQHCGACSGGQHHTTVLLPGDAPVGALVTVDMPENKVLAASLMAYAAPLLMLVLGVFLGSLFFESEALWAACGCGLLALSGPLLRWIDKKIKGRAGWQPRIIAIKTEGEKNNGNEAE